MADFVTFLGTSDGLPSTDRSHASLLVRMAGRTILLDCGEPCSHTLKRMGVDFNSIDAVVITHTHSDHVGGFPMLLQSMWLEKRRRPLPVWMPGHGIPPLRDWLSACYLFEPLLGFPLKWVALDKHPAMKCGPVQMRTFRTAHLDGLRKKFAASYPRVQFNAFSILATARGKRLAYSADLSGPQDLLPLCANPLDLLVVELAHFHPRALFEFLLPKKIRRVAVTHMGRPVKAQLSEVKSLARKTLGPRIIRFVEDDETVKF
jgi:ribonuclease BN (tRNA processing enzyme)